MTPFTSQQFPTLFRKRYVTAGLADAVQKINTDIETLCGEYDRLREVAPSRSARNRRYFVGHDGRPWAKNRGNPSEKHLAIALWRLREDWPRTGGGRMRLLDYEVPLRASRSDAGLGEVDLLGATDQGRWVVVELKVGRKDGSRDDTPLLALMEGLRYAAVIHANHRAISAEASDRFAIDVRDEPPIVQILATEDWWGGWCDMGRRSRAAGLWEPAFSELSNVLEDRLGIFIECLALQGTTLADVTWDAHGPFLGNTPLVRRVHLDGAPAPQPQHPEKLTSP